jgi:hypothetical protein
MFQVGGHEALEYLGGQGEDISQIDRTIVKKP